MSRVPLSYFQRMYSASDDPWDFESSAYERRKYQLTMASLPADRYRSGFEPGCSIGVLTKLLASRCDRLLATDVIPDVVDRAARRVAAHPGVQVECRAIPEKWPEGSFDLIVVSELGYYFDRAGLETLVACAVGALEPGGTLHAVHWQGETDYPLTAGEVHDLMDAQPDLCRVVHHDEPSFLLDSWIRQ